MSSLAKFSTSIIKDTHPDIYRAFAPTLDAIWRAGGERRPLGLAISGGVDSMALATLCREFRERARLHSKSTPTFTAFIVDHQLRPGSANEARAVAAEMQRLDIAPRVLRLDWTGYADPRALPNLESVARRLRYRALGRACRDAGVATLLVGHHADDQAETALMRMVGGYTGAGLAGMQAAVALPECRGMYGVDGSGRGVQTTRGFDVESGGVRVHRPLLAIRKKQLIDVCRERGVRWFEDHTNADATLTLRNAVRSLLQNEAVLPQALRHARLLHVTRARDANESRSEDEAETLFASVPLTLHVRSGEAIFTLDNTVRGRLRQQENIARRVISRILHLVTPKSKISLQDLDRGLALILDDGGTEGSRQTHPGSSKAQMAGVQMQRRSEGDKETDSRSFTVFRALPPATEVEALTVQLWPYQALSTAEEPAVASLLDVMDQWRLWDGRYWIRVRPPPINTTARADVRVVARLLNADGLAQLRGRSRDRDTDDGAARARKRLQRLATHEIRLTLPAIFTVASDSTKEGKGGVREELVAVPSVDWYAPGWTDGSTHQERLDSCWSCEMRYKHVDLRDDQVDASLRANNAK